MFVIVEKVPLTKSLEVFTRGGIVPPFNGHVNINACGQNSDKDAQNKKDHVKGVSLHVSLPPQQPEVEERWQHKGQYCRGQAPHQSKAQLKTRDFHCYGP